MVDGKSSFASIKEAKPKKKFRHIRYCKRCGEYYVSPTKKSRSCKDCRKPVGGYRRKE